MGRKKQGNGRDSNPKFLETKIFSGQTVTAGSIIVRQRGRRIKPGRGVGIGKDYTIFSLVDGMVDFIDRDGRKIVNVTPISK